MEALNQAWACGVLTERTLCNRELVLFEPNCANTETINPSHSGARDLADGGLEFLDLLSMWPCPDREWS